MTPPNTIEPIMTIDKSDFNRLENKVDDMAKTIQSLILIEERISNQGSRIGKTEERLAVLETNYYQLNRKVDQWINRGIGVWVTLCIIGTILIGLTQLAKHLGA